VFGSDPTLTRHMARERQVASQFVKLWSIDDQLVVADPQRQDVPYVLPGNRILVVPVAHEPFDIDRAVNHLRRGRQAIGRKP